MLVEQRFKGAFGLCTDQSIDQLAVFEQQQRGNAHHTELSGGGGVVIDIELADLDTALVLTGEFFDHRGNDAARATPRSPEVHECYALLDFVAKVGICQFNRFHAGEYTPSGYGVGFVLHGQVLIGNLTKVGGIFSYPVTMNPKLRPGAALFNAGHWWEAHEAWEGEWMKATGTERQFIQALILLAAALHKRWRHGSLTHRNYDKALKYLDALPDEYGGVNLKVLRAEVWQALQQEEQHPQIPVLPD